MTLEQALKLESGVELDRLIHEVVFGKSLNAKTESQIARAVMDGMTCSNGNATADFCWSGKHYTGQPLIHSGVGGMNAEYGWSLWQLRGKKPYRKSLESHVAAWRETCPIYSTHIAAAWQVVEKMRADGWSFACSLYHEEISHASFCKKTAASSRRADCDPLTLAICRAALQAVGSPNPAKETT